MDRAVSPTRAAPFAAQARSIHAHFAAWRGFAATASCTQHTRLIATTTVLRQWHAGMWCAQPSKCNGVAERVTCHACRWCPSLPPTACSRRCVEVVRFSGNSDKGDALSPADRGTTTHECGEGVFVKIKQLRYAAAQQARQREGRDWHAAALDRAVFPTTTHWQRRRAQSAARRGFALQSLSCLYTRGRCIMNATYAIAQHSVAAIARKLAMCTAK